MPLGEKFLTWSERGRWPILGAATGLTFAITVADWKVEPHVNWVKIIRQSRESH